MSTLWPTLDVWGYALSRYLLAVLWQSSLLFVAVLALHWALRRSRAAARHVLWVSAALLMPLLPMLSTLAYYAGTPQAPFAVLPAYEAPDVAEIFVVEPGTAAPMVNEAVITPPDGLPQDPPAPPRARDYPWALLLLAYLSGLVPFLMLYAMGHARIAWWVRGARPVTDARLLAAFGPCRPRIMGSPTLCAPVTVGLLRPVVLFPQHLADNLADEELQAVALHETAHAQRRDPLLLSLAALVRALLYFHPLVWVAARQINVLAEQAADDVALDATGTPLAYAKLLTRLAEGCPRRSSSVEFAAGMVFSRGAFLQRVEAVLSGRRNHIRRLTRWGLAMTLLIALGSLAVALALPLAERREVQSAKAATVLDNEETGEVEAVVDTEDVLRWRRALERFDAKLRTIDPQHYRDKKRYANVLQDYEKSDEFRKYGYRAFVAAVEAKLAAEDAVDPVSSWRAHDVLGEIAGKRGDDAAALAAYESAIAAYPEVGYLNPAQVSFLQHLYNTVAMIKAQDDAQAAEEWFFAAFAEDPRFVFLFSQPWEERYGADTAAFAKWQRRAAAAYESKAKRFPELAEKLAAYRAHFAAEEAVNAQDWDKAIDEKLASLRGLGPNNFRDKNDLTEVLDAYTHAAGDSPDYRPLYEIVGKKLAELPASDDIAAWRLAYLLAKTAERMDQKREYGEALVLAIAAYPDIDYADPSEHSKLQHLWNEHALLIAENEGLKKAEDYFVDAFRQDVRWLYAFLPPWAPYYRNNGMAERLPRFQQRIIDAYAEKAVSQPDKAALLRRYREELRAEVEEHAKSAQDSTASNVTMAEALAGIGARWDALRAKRLVLEYTRTYVADDGAPVTHRCLLLAHNGNYREQVTDEHGRTATRYFHDGLRAALGGLWVSQDSKASYLMDLPPHDAVDAEAGRPLLHYHPYNLMHHVNSDVARQWAAPSRGWLQWAEKNAELHETTLPDDVNPIANASSGRRCVLIGRPGRFEAFAPDLEWAWVGTCTGSPETPDFTCLATKIVPFRQGVMFPDKITQPNWVVDVITVRTDFDATLAPPRPMNSFEVMFEYESWPQPEGAARIAVENHRWPLTKPSDQDKFFVARTRWRLQEFAAAIDQQYPLPFYEDASNEVVWAEYIADANEWVKVHTGRELPERYGPPPWQSTEESTPTASADTSTPPRRTL